MARVGWRNPFCPFVRIDGSPAPLTKKQPFGGFGTPRPGQAVYGRKVISLMANSNQELEFRAITGSCVTNVLLHKRFGAGKLSGSESNDRNYLLFETFTH